MYARVTTVQLQPDKAQEANRSLCRLGGAGGGRQQPGNQGAWLLIDRATGKGVSISLWDSDTDMEAGEASGYYQQQLGKFGPLMTAPPVREVYEVAVQG